MSKTPELKFNMIRTVLTPMFKKKLNLKKLQKVTFKAFKIHDRLEMEGCGEEKDSAMWKISKCDPMKVSDNSNYESMLTRNMDKQGIKYKQWDICYLTLDYDTGIIKTEVWYVGVDGVKKHQEFKNTF